MSVEMGTALAGSGQSTRALGGGDTDQGRFAPQRSNDLEDGTVERLSMRPSSRMPSRDRLAWVCDRCQRQLRGSMGELSGFVAVDMRETHAAAKGLLRGPDGPVKARWRVYHATCAPECVKAMNPYFRLWTHRVQSVDDLLDAVAELSRLPWFGWSDWGGSLVKKVLADTGKTIDESVALREQRAQRKRKQARAAQRANELADNPDDPRHGTVTGYQYKCRCDRCKAANAQDWAKRRKEKE